MKRFWKLMALAFVGGVSLAYQAAWATDEVAPTVGAVASSLTNVLYPALLTLFGIIAAVTIVFFTKDVIVSLIKKHRRA